MNLLNSKHFIYLDENLKDFTLESYALNVASKRKKIIFIDKKRSSDDCIESFLFIKRRNFGKAGFLDVENFQEIENIANSTDILFIRYFNEDDKPESWDSLFDFFSSHDMYNTTILLNLSDFLFNPSNFQELCDELSKRGNQLGIRTDDPKSFQSLSFLKNVIFYRNYQNIEFL